MFALSLDMGGSHIGCAIVRDREILANRSLNVESAKGLSSTLPLIEQTLRELLEDSGAKFEDCRGVAVGFPGIIDA